MFAFLSRTVCNLMLCSNQWNWTVARYLSDHHKQFILNTFHNSPFIPVIVGKITALARVTLEQGLWKCPNISIITTVSYHITVFQFVLQCDNTGLHNWFLCTETRPERHCPLSKNTRRSKEQDKKGHTSQEFTEPRQGHLLCSITHWWIQSV